MKICLINNVFPFGSTGKIVENLYKTYVANGHECFVIYGSGAKSKKELYRVCNKFYIKLQIFLSKFTGNVYGGCFFSTIKVLKIIKKEVPDLVHIHCINGYFLNIYKLIDFFKKTNICTVITNHAEFLYTGNCSLTFNCNQFIDGCKKCETYKNEFKLPFRYNVCKNWTKMCKSFDGLQNIRITSVSSWLDEKSKKSFIFGNFRNCVVYNGVDTNVFKPCCSSKNNKIKQILFVTPRFTDSPYDNKGGYFLIEMAKKMPSVHFTIVGKIIKEFTSPSNVEIFGQVFDQSRLAELYSNADLTVVVSKRETYSMVVAESLCCGTPVIGFKSGGPESICINEFCSFVKYGDIDNLVSTAYDFLNKNFDNFYISQVAFHKYSIDIMAKKYLEIYKELYE